MQGVVVWPRLTKVKKVTGDYQIEGTIVGHAEMLNGKVRYVVEHKAEGGGSFLHIYAEANLRIIELRPEIPKAPATPPGREGLKPCPEEVHEHLCAYPACNCAPQREPSKPREAGHDCKAGPRSCDYPNCGCADAG